MKQQYPPFAKLLLLIASIAFSCCSSTEPSQTDQILQQLLSIPVFHPPIPTTENADNPGFTAADSTHTEIFKLLDICYRQWILSIQEDEIRARKIQSGYQWIQRPAPSGYTGVILSVITGDTLHFQLELESFQSPNNLIIQGWVSPSLAKGSVYDSNPTWRWNWESTDTAHRAKYIVPSFFGDGLHMTVIDSLSGGGLIDIWDYRHHIIAKWDLSGHGSWWAIPGDIFIEW